MNAEKAGSGISDLQKRLDELKRKFALNEIEMRKADNEANIAAKNAEEAGQVWVGHYYGHTESLIALLS
jgi:hypothetical protein